MYYCVEHVSLVRSDMQVVNTEKSEVMIIKNAQNPPKTVVTLLHETCAVQHIFDKKEYKVKLMYMYSCSLIFICRKSIRRPNG